MNTSKIFKKGIAVLVIILFILQVFAPMAVYAATVEKVTTTKYQVKNNVIMRVEANTTVSEFLNNISVDSGATMGVYKDNTQVAGTEKMATGMVLKVGESTEYQVAVRGDANGDGKVTVTDLSLFKLHILNINVLQSPLKNAIDINYDGEITMLDGSQLKMILVGLELPLPGEISVEGDIRIEADTTEYVQTLGITVYWPENVEGLTKQVSLNNGNTYQEYTGKVNMTSNNTVIARLVDGNGRVVKTATLTVTNIDSEGPLAFDFNYVHKIANYITLTGQTTDAVTGVAGYKFTYTNGNNWLPTAGKTTGEYTFMDVPATSTVELKMKAIDRVGNERETNKKAQRTFTEGIKLLKNKLGNGITVNEASETITLPDGRIYRLAVTSQGSYRLYAITINGEETQNLNEATEINAVITAYESNGAKTLAEVLTKLTEEEKGTGVLDQEALVVEKAESYVRYQIVTLENGKHEARFIGTITKNGQTTTGQMAEQKLLEEIDEILEAKVETDTVSDILEGLIEDGKLLKENVNKTRGTFETEVGTVYAIYLTEDEKYARTEVGLAEDIQNGIIEGKILEVLENELQNEVIDWAIADGLTTEVKANRQDGTYENMQGQYKRVEINFADGTYQTVDAQRPAGATITYTLNPDFPTMATKTELTINATDPDGITKIEVFTERGEERLKEIYDPAKTEAEEKIELTDNGIYYIKVTSADGDVATKAILVGNIDQLLPIKVTVNPETPRNTAKTGTQNGVVAGPISVTLKYSEAISLTNANKYQYQKGGTEGEWTTATKIQEITGIETNSVIYARYFDGEKSIKQIKIEISNVDNTAPESFEHDTVINSHSITVKAETTDTAKDNNGTEAREGVAGVGRYLYKLGNGEWQENALFSNLTQDTKYKVYVKAVDHAGNETESDNSGDEVTTPKVPEANGLVEFTYSDKNLTKENVLVGFTGILPDESYKIQYQISTDGSAVKPNGTWIDGEEFEATSNCIIYVRIADITGQVAETGGYAEGEVANIDNKAPLAFTPDAIEVTENSIKVNASRNNGGQAIDAPATTTYACSGTVKYEYYIAGAGMPLTSAKDKTEYTHTFTGLNEGTTYAIYVVAIDLVGNKTTSTIIEVTTEGTATDDDKWELGIDNINKGPGNVTVNGEEPNYYNPVIPVGFKAINTPDANWEGKVMRDGWNKGLVIEDINGSQFVWVPVDGETIKYEKWHNLFAPGTTKDPSKIEEEIATGLEQLGEEEKKQIEDYKGFYIGRYEAGNDNGVLASKAGIKAINGKTYEIAKDYAEGMYENQWVKSGLLSGTAWDTAVKWIASEKGENYVKKDTTTGNNRSLGYTFSGIYAKGPEKAGELRGVYENGTNVAKPAGKSYLLGTGLVDQFKAKNIFDLAGNVWEYTYEYTKNKKNEIERIVRGGDYYRPFGTTSNWGSAMREQLTGPTAEARNESGFRVMLYLVEGVTEVGKYADYNRTMDGKPATYKNPIIPAGYAATNDGAKWGNGKDVAPEWNNGLVITDRVGNEFVWVPVDKKDVKYEKWLTTGEGYEEATDDTLPGKLTEWEETEKTQVDKYGGFYVARYESSKEVVDNKEKAATKANKTAWTNINYTNAKTAAEGLDTKKYVASGLITGKQWDTVMKWISNEKGVVKVANDSTTWGDYMNSTLGKDARAKQIYLLAGGAWEWTTEIKGVDSAYRGGVKTDRGDSSPAGYRAFKNGVTIDEETTFRMVLYITGDIEGLATKPVTDTEPLEGTKYPAQANAPSLGGVLIPIKWAGSSWAQTTADDPEWYEYVDTSEGEANSSRWANAMSNDGSFWVWIPRFAYKILPGQQIDVIFLDGTTNKPISGEDLPAGYIVHPAFIGNPYAGGWDYELRGIWVAKFEAGSDGSSRPGVYSYANRTGGDAFNTARNLGAYRLGIDSHMIKNTEWGAATYLAHSKYGVNGRVIGAAISTSVTGYDYVNRTTPSTTGNIYGIYDMAGGKPEFVAGYWQYIIDWDNANPIKTFVYEFYEGNGHDRKWTNAKKINWNNKDYTFCKYSKYDKRSNEI